jgi:hypothetical protein
VSRGQASERAVCVYEAVSVEKGARRPPLPTAVVCTPGRRRRRRLANGRFPTMPGAAFWRVKSVTGSNAALAGRGCVWYVSRSRISKDLLEVPAKLRGSPRPLPKTAPSYRPPPTPLPSVNPGIADIRVCTGWNYRNRFSSKFSDPGFK